MIWYYLLVFLGGAFTMAVELAGARLIAPYLGVSLFTWTSIIGVVLAGISGGNFVGGWMADRWPPRKLLVYLLLAAGALVAAIIPLLPAVMGLTWPGAWPALLKVVVPITLIFGLPSCAIGLISPVIYRICLTDPCRTGRTVGRLAAAGALGSIGGTFATGFWLIPVIGTRSILYGVAAGLCIVGLVCMSWKKTWRGGAAGTALILAIVLGLGPLESVLHVPGQEESAYYTIKVTEAADSEVGTVKKLVLDSLVHSAANPQRPEYLWYEYEQISAWLIQQAMGEAPVALFIGGGGYTLPAWMENHYSQAAIEVVEIDPAVTRVALREFINPGTRIKTHNMDGRMALKNQPASSKYDFIYGDAFNDLSVPYHLTTLEFGMAVRQRLQPGGIYVANIVDKPDGPFLGAFSYTLTHVFPYVYILPASDSVLWGNRGPNLVVASMTEIPWEQWKIGANLPFTVEARLPAGSNLLLTDDFVPVDNLLLPVFADRLKS